MLKKFFKSIWAFLEVIAEARAAAIKAKAQHWGY